MRAPPATASEREPVVEKHGAAAQPALAVVEQGDHGEGVARRLRALAETAALVAGEEGEAEGRQQEDCNGGQQQPQRPGERQPGGASPKATMH